MPDYLNFEKKLADLNDTDAQHQLKVQFERLNEAINRLEEGDRVSPLMMERMVSV